MIELALIVFAAIAVLVAAILRPILGRTSDERNIERLRLRYTLDRPTAERLYQVARRDGFASAWKAVIEGPPDVAQTARTGSPSRTRTTTRGRRSLADRHRA